MAKGGPQTEAAAAREFLVAAEIPALVGGRRRDRPGCLVWVHWATYDELVRYRRGDEPMDRIVARLIRFAKRMTPAVEARVREEFLP